MSEVSKEYALPVVGQDALMMAVGELRDHGSDEFEGRMYDRMQRKNSGLMRVLAETFRAANITDARRRAATRAGMVLTHQLVDNQSLLDWVESTQHGDMQQLDPTALHAQMHAPVVTEVALDRVRAEIVELGPFEFLDQAEALLERNNPELSRGVFAFVSASSFGSPDVIGDAKFAMSMTHRFLAAQALVNQVGGV